MTAIADEIRELTGASGALNLDAMDFLISETNNEVDSQAKLIAQIIGALDNKAVGGKNVEMSTCTVVVYVPNMQDFTVYYLNDSLQATTIVLDAMTGGTFQAAKGTIIAIKPWSSMAKAEGATEFMSNGYCGVYAVDDNVCTLSFDS